MPLLALLRQSYDLVRTSASQRELSAEVSALKDEAAAVAHDLRSPPGTVRSYIELVRPGLLRPPPPEAHERAAVDSSRAQLLVESTLRRHRIIVSEDSVAGREVAQLDAVLRDVRVALGVELANARARIDADSLPSVLGDRNALARVFQKLVENGLKHAALGSVPRIRVSASVIGQRCEIEVRDWGVGIALDQQERVFARYEGYEGSPANRRPQRSSLD